MFRQIFRQPLLLALGALFLGYLSPHANAASASFAGLGDLPDGRFTSIADGVSGDGSVAVGFSYTGAGVFEFQGFRWTRQDGIALLWDLPTRSSAKAASFDGSVIVGGGSDFGAFLWTAGTGAVRLGDISGDDGTGTSARDVFDDGRVVVGRMPGEPAMPGEQAMRWTAQDSIVGLGDLPGGEFRSIATGISADGSTIVGLASSSTGREPFRWTAEEGMVSLGTLSGNTDGNVARAVSADGSVVVGNSFSASGLEAFRWTDAGGMVGLGALPDAVFSSSASDVSAGGTVVVGSSREKAFIWDESHGMRDIKQMLVDDGGIDLTGWKLADARSISADGRTIVGEATNPQGNVEGWITTVPEPSSLALLAAGAAGIAAFCRRRRAD